MIFAEVSGIAFSALLRAGGISEGLLTLTRTRTTAVECHGVRTSAKNKIFLTFALPPSGEEIRRFLDGALPFVWSHFIA